MRKAAGRLLAFGMILCLLLGLIGTAAADGLHQEIKNELLDVEILPGYDGAITYGKPFPVRVTVRMLDADRDLSEISGETFGSGAGFHTLSLPLFGTVLVRYDAE